jgi:hypothetical protein
MFIRQILLVYESLTESSALNLIQDPSVRHAAHSIKNVYNTACLSPLVHSKKGKSMIRKQTY